MEIKISLKQLVALFHRSAGNEELPPPVRQFAAQLTVLTAHVQRVEAKIEAETQARIALDSHIAEIATLLMAARQPEAPNAAPAPSPIQGNAETVAVDEEDEAKAMAEQVLRETEAEAAAIVKTPEKPGAPITPLRANKKAATSSTKEAS